MNIIFNTMGGIFKIYYDLYLSLIKKEKVTKAGFFICDREYHSNHGINLSDLNLLKEWEITDSISKYKINYNELQRVEKEYFNNESFWSAMYNDRRIFLGKYCKVVQQYQPFYNHNDILKLFLRATLEAEKFIDEIKPDVILGFIPSTFVEYIIYKIAKAKNILFLFHRSIKIYNYLTFSTDLEEKYSHIENTYKFYLKNGIKDTEYKKIAENYLIDFTKKNKLFYEGVLKNDIKVKNFVLNYPYKLLKLLILDTLQINKKRDHHNRIYHTKNFCYDNILRDYKALQFHRRYKDRILSNSDLKKTKYIFYPLHSEPEIAITLLAKYYQNQIEVIRNIALQLTSNQILVVKEHPRNKGRRSWNYYNKILEIPNVYFSKLTTSTSELTKNALLTVVLSGSTGFEAILNQRPAIVLGNVAYKMLPKNIVNYVDNIKDLYHEIQWSINNFLYNETIILAYLTAMIKHSIPIDFYTVMLRKTEREGGSEYSIEKYNNNINHLTKYLIDRVKFFTHA